MPDLEDIVQRIALAGSDDVIEAFGHVGTAGVEAFKRIAEAAGPVGKVLAGAAGGLAGLVGGSFLWAERSSQAAHSLEILSLQSGESVEKISSLQSALSAMGVDSANLQGMFRRLGSTVTEAWNQVRIDVTNAANVQIKDTLSVEKAEQALFNARQKHLKVLNETGDVAHQLATPEQQRLEKRKESQTDLEEHEEALRLAEKKRRDDQRNDPENYTRAVKQIIAGTKNAADAAKEANLSVENITKGLIANTPGAAEAMKNFNGTLESISAFGPKVLDTLGNIADFIKNSGNAALNSAVQMHLFGRTMGTEMIVALAQGSQAFKDFQKRMEDLGLVITGPMVKAGVEFHESFNRLSSALSITTQQIGLMFAPAFTEQMQTFTEYVIKNHEAIMAWAADMVGQVKPIIIGFFDALKGLVGAVSGIDVGGGKAEEWKKTWTEIGKVFKMVGDTIASVLNGIKTAIDSVFGTDVSKFTAGLVGLGIWKLVGASIGGSIMAGIGSVLLGPEGIAAIIAAAAAAAGIEYFLTPKKPEPVRGGAHVATTEELFAKEEEAAESEFASKVQGEAAEPGGMFTPPSERYVELKAERDRKLAEIEAERQRVKAEPGYEATAREHALANLDAMGLLRTSVDKQIGSTDALTETNKQLVEELKKGGKEEAKPGAPAGTVTTSTIDQTSREAVTRIGGGAIINVEKSLKEFNESLKSTSAFVSPSSRTDAAKFYENTKVTEENTKSIDRNTAVSEQYTSPGFGPMRLESVQGRPPTDKPEAYADYQRQMNEAISKSADTAREAAVERKAVETATTAETKRLTEAIKTIEKPGLTTFAERFMPPEPTVPSWKPLTDAQYGEVQRKRHEEELRFRREDYVTTTKRSDALTAAVQESAPAAPAAPPQSAEVVGARIMDAWGDRQAKKVADAFRPPPGPTPSAEVVGTHVINEWADQTARKLGDVIRPAVGEPTRAAGGLGAPMVVGPGIMEGITKFAQYATDLFSRLPTPTFQTLARGGVEPTAREVEAGRSAAEREALDRLLGVKSDQQRAAEEAGATRTTSLMEKMDTLVRSVLVTVSGPTGKQEQISIFQAMLGVLTQILGAIKDLGSKDSGKGSGGGKMVEQAAGGPIRGHGSGTSDDVPAMLSVGEYVVRADGSNLGEAISHFRPHAWGGLIARGDYAKGGEVEVALANSTNLNQAWSSYAFGGDVKSTTQNLNTASEQSSISSGDVKSTSSTNVDARLATGGPVSGDTVIQHFAGGGPVNVRGDVSTRMEANAVSHQQSEKQSQQKASDGSPERQGDFSVRHTVTGPNITQEVSHFAIGGPVGGSGTSDVRDRHGSTRQPSVLIRPDTDSSSHISNIRGDDTTNINASHFVAGGLVGGDADTTNINALSRIRYDGSDNSITAHTGGLIDHIIRNYVTGGLVSNLVSSGVTNLSSVFNSIASYASGGPVPVTAVVAGGGALPDFPGRRASSPDIVGPAIAQMFNGGLVGGGGLAQTMQAASAPSMMSIGGGIGEAGPTGHPVNIVIDGNTFSGFTAPPHAIDQVQNYAVDRKLRSGGSKPSWYR
jgi:hypothetical protein